MDDSSQRIIQFPHMLLLKLHFRNKKVESTPRYPKVFGKPQISSDLGLWRDPIAGILERLGSNGGVRLVVAGFSKRKMMVLRRFHQPKIWIYQDSYGFIKKRWKISENPIWTRKKITQSINRHGDFKFHGNFHAGLCHNFSKSSTLLYPTIAGKPSDSSALSYVSPLNSHISGYNLYITIYTMYT